MRNGQPDSNVIATINAVNAWVEDTVSIPKGVVITTLATEAWLVVFVVAAGARALLSWML